MYKSTDYVDILYEKKCKYKRYCEYCGHTMSFYSFEKDRKLCNYCGNYNYRDEKSMFKYLLNKKLDNLL